ncbi:DNA cytosine methyltransferase [Kitasatospora sp. NPDC057965]|uniref:DNA cytosine methyltransferase n=1 Tax=Kitasatospora sp. NPDC057965 TaxID=3346291 RepID=UPI0036DC60D6
MGGPLSDPGRARSGYRPLSSAGEPMWFGPDHRMGPWSYGELIARAHPWPVSWLFPPRPGDPPRIVNLFAGPAGWEQGLRILDPRPGAFDVVGVEIGPDAAATARAAGHRRIVCDVRTLDPTHPALRHVVGLIVSAPCQVWTPAGKRQGRDERNIRLLEEVLSRAVEGSFGHWHDDGECDEAGTCTICCDPAWDGNGGWTGPLLSRADVREPIAQMSDPSIGLIAETVIWALTLTARFDALCWLAMEQSSALPHVVTDALRDALDLADWYSSDVRTLDAADIGLASHRRRTYLVAGRHQGVSLSAAQPADPMPARTAAQALGWRQGIRVNTRGNRSTAGGNEWSADATATAITGRSRSWYWADDPERRITTGEASLLVGMPADHPWEGSPSAQHGQIGDVVAPTEAARVLAQLVGRPWPEPVRSYLENLYSPASQALAAATDARLLTRRAAAAASSSPALPGLEDLGSLPAPAPTQSPRRAAGPGR